MLLYHIEIGVILYTRLLNLFSPYLVVELVNRYTILLVPMGRPMRPIGFIIEPCLHFLILSLKSLKNNLLFKQRLMLNGWWHLQVRKLFFWGA